MRVNRLSVLILPSVLAGVLPAAGQEPAEDRWVSLTETVFLGLRLNRHVELVVNPEVAGPSHSLASTVSI